jgi:hypothetical protein
LLNADEFPSMTATVAELSLSASYREAQRTLAAWLECGQREARRGAFAARAALAGLDAVERHRLARWLAWLCLAAGLRGAALQSRVRHLDGALGDATATALAQLPAGPARVHGHPRQDWSMPSRLGA